MDNIRKEFIKEIMLTLKIEGVFNSGTIADEIQHIPDTSLRAFHKALFDKKNRAFHGMDRITNVAEQFKPEIQDDSMELKAKVLIVWCESANEAVYLNAKESGRTFDEEMKGTMFIGLNSDDISILNQVKPYSNHKRLVSEINHYQDSKVQLKAFMDALKYTPTETLIESVKNMRLGR